MSRNTVSISTVSRKRVAVPALALCFVSWAVLEVQAAELKSILAPRAEVKKIAGDCAFTEGPAWSPEGFLLFSDIPNNRIVQWKRGTVSDFLKPSGNSNGLLFDGQGRLWACQHGSRQVALIEGDKSIVPIVNGFERKKLNSPNDLAVDNYGGLYFTDPRYGDSGDPVEQPVMGVYYVDASGKVTRVIDDLERPNGILVSPKGDMLYVAEPNRRELYRYSIVKPGIINGKKLIFTGDEKLDGGGPDGMAHDVDGNIYATYKDVVVLNSDGGLIGRIEVPERTSNCAFGGRDGKTLFITAQTSVYSVKTKVMGMSFKKFPGPASTGGRQKVAIRDLIVDVPLSWRKVTPKMNFELVTLEIDAVQGDREPAKVVGTMFPGIQGGYGAQARRWLGRFTKQDVKYKIYKGQWNQGDYYLLDAYGSYHRRGPVKPILEARMLGVMLQRQDGLYFLQLLGYQNTVSAEEEEFRRTFGGDRAREVEVKIDDI